MKYSELKAKVEELGFKVNSTLYSEDLVVTSEHAKPIYLARISTEEYGSLSTDYMAFKGLDNNTKAKLLKALTTLALTPLEDREEPKLYHLWSNKVTGSVYIYYKSDASKTGISALVSDSYDKFSENYFKSSFNSMYLFTQAELDDLPDFANPKKNPFMYPVEVKTDER